ncbi:SipW-dependent-type signal peptide-containing protein [Brachybacterium epidermidis]|uniref:SipW-dependent-type signal peptide-containing protein n=1 Tax=Brachybacterium epidermidis TaxID=2781983 RepID=UPI00398EDB5B
MRTAPSSSSVADARTATGRAWELRRMPAPLRAAAFLALMLLAVLSGMGGSYALWSDQQSLEGGTVTTGTAALDAQWRDEGGTQMENLVPGQSGSRSAVLRNEGDTPLEISASAESSAMRVGAIAGACTSPSDAAGLDDDPVPLPSPSSGGTLVLASQESAEVCVTFTAGPELTPGQTTTGTILFEGSQV